jgi:hypothetical protein
MSTISAGTTSGTALISSGDTTGQLVFQTNGTTTALTIGTDQIVTVAGAATGGEVRVNEALANGTNYVAVKAPTTLASNVTFTLPSADGTNGQLLQTNGSGVLSFTNPTSFASPLAVVGNSTAGAEIRLPEDTDNGANYVAIKAPDVLAANLTLTLPSADGTNGQLLQTNGSGALSFTTVSTGVTEVGSVARIPQTRNLYMFSPSATVLTGVAKLAVNYFYPSGTGPTPGSIFLPQYSTYYGAWYTAIGNALAFSTDGINFTFVDFYGSNLTQVTLYNSSSLVSPYVIDDVYGYIFAFGYTSAGYPGYVFKTSLTSSWSAAVNLTSAAAIWYAEFVSFPDAANSGIVFGWSDSSTHYVSTIPAGASSSTVRASTSNNNGQKMSFDWNKTAGVAMSVQRTPSSGQAALFLSPTNNVNTSWTSVTSTTSGVNVTNPARPIISNAGYGVIWDNNQSSYRYTTTTTLNGAWTNANTPDGNRIFYMGHNGTVWYMATGTTGTPPVTGAFRNFYTTTSATPTSWVSTPQIPLLGLTDASSFEVATVPYYTQRKY